MQDPRRGEVDEEARHSGGQHPATDDARRVGEPPDRRPDDPAAEQDEHERVRERCEHLGAAPAEAPLRGRRPLREPGGEEGKPERERVRDHVRRVCEERQRIGGASPTTASTPAKPATRARAIASARLSPPCECTPAP